MSSSGATQLDHGRPPLSTEARSASERDNRVRYTGAAGGHVESHFLKANSPDGARALWLRYTLLSPVGRPEAGRAEVWAVAFDQRGLRKLAQKQTFPIAAARFSSAPFALHLPCAELRHGAASGALDGGAGARLGWDLRFLCPETGFRPFRYSAMYERGFPRSKTLTPAPDTRVDGLFELGDERWEIAGWRGSQGHNWGQSHAHAYGWVHSNALRPAVDRAAPALPDTWLEAFSGRVRVGRQLTPMLSVAALTVAGQTFRFDGLGALLARRVRLERFGYSLSLAQGGARLEGRFEAQPEQFAGLRYEDPDGSALTCLNSKLASGTLTFSHRGRELRLFTDQAALELVTRAQGDGEGDGDEPPVRLLA